MAGIALAIVVVVLVSKTNSCNRMALTENSVILLVILSILLRGWEMTSQDALHLEELQNHRPRHYWAITIGDCLS